MRAAPHAALYAEMAFIASHFHWGRDELMALEHRERRRWCREISAANRALDAAARGADASPNPFDV